MAQQITPTGTSNGNTPQIIAAGVESTVDPLYLASRMALRPLDYTGQGSVLGHYAVAQKSGNTVSVSANSHIARLRWAPTSANNNVYCVLMRLKIGWAAQAAITAAVQQDFDASIARSFTVDHSANNTIINLAAPARQNVMRSGQGMGAMSSSLMGSNGPAICTTVGMTGQTATLDNAAFAMQVFDAVPAVNATLNIPVGRGNPLITMYEWTGLGQHPVVLSMNEGVIVRQLTAGVTTGAVNLYLQWEWAEVFVF